MRRPCGYLLLLLLLVPLLLMSGCRGGAPAAFSATTLPATGLEPATFLASVGAIVSPPSGWESEQLKESSGHAHQVWVSPTGSTAYGVIRFSLPVPVGHDVALWGFLREMRRREGEAELLAREWDANQRVLRFVAQGGLYTVRTKLSVRGFSGWAVYAGTLTGEPVRPDELDLAERAREHTLLGARAGDQTGN